MSKAINGLCIIALILIISPAVAFCCSPSPFPPPPICERFWEGDAVALVEVTNISETKTHERRRVTLRVLDVFRGDPPLEITIKDPFTSCGVNFGQKGQYLAWLFREKDTWKAYGDRAGRWGAKEIVNDDLRFAQAMKHPPETARIYGTLDQPRSMVFVTEPAATPIPSRAGAVVVTKGASGTFQGTVNAEGRFEIPSVPPGKYTVSVLGLPTNLSAESEEFEVHAGGCKELFLFSASSARLKGRVFGAGKLPHFPTMHLVPLNPAKATHRDDWVLAEADTGEFEFKHVEPGKYVLGFHLKKSPTLDVPYASRYYPDAKDITSAEVFEIREGQQVNNIEFNVGSEVPRRRVHVRVTWPDGTPAPKATAYLRDAHNSYSSVADEQTETDSNGEAVLEGFIDTDYDVDANANCARTLDSRDVKLKVIPASSADAYVELRVAGPKCVLVGNRYLQELEKLE
ncbi:MAG TPA: carboxypeptidase-like regulatory domain-containing protein [Terriglobales bacterium]|nr:carboxypeptidase-like regulatory domain-containing protein [Terriglobales bacterium]